MTTVEDARTRAAAGAAKLTEKDPDWFTVVSTAELDMGCPGWCVLGQWAGSYTDGAERLLPGVNPQSAEGDRLVASLGLEASNFGDADEEYETLRDAWVEIIRELKRVRRVEQITTGGGA
jgi:hypothetical protein